MLFFASFGPSAARIKVKNCLAQSPAPAAVSQGEAFAGRTIARILAAPRLKGVKNREDVVAANVRFSNPKTLAKPPGYSYVVEATGPNRLIFIAGQLGLDMDNKLVGMAGDFRAQANKAIDNLKLALADAGATIKDVVKINNYLVDMSHIAIFREVRDQHFNMSAPPASTTVAISQLARPGALFEIEAIAVLPAKAAKSAKAKSAARRGSRKKR
jgi:enamine deaminase RidA (YjgF/YER057c/UK114 family)